MIRKRVIASCLMVFVVFCGAVQAQSTGMDWLIESNQVALEVDKLVHEVRQAGEVGEGDRATAVDLGSQLRSLLVAGQDLASQAADDMDTGSLRQRERSLNAVGLIRSNFNALAKRHELVVMVRDGALWDESGQETEAFLWRFEVVNLLGQMVDLRGLVLDGSAIEILEQLSY